MRDDSGSMGRSSAKQKYTPKAAAGPAAGSGGPALCIDTIADPEFLQQHIQVCIELRIVCFVCGATPCSGR